MSLFSERQMRHKVPCNTLHSAQKYSSLKNDIKKYYIFSKFIQTLLVPSSSLQRTLKQRNLLD